MSGQRIFIVDDQREVSRVLSEGLRTLEQDFEIVEMLSGEEAVLELSKGQVDLLVSDIKLPGMDGFELMNKLKKHHSDMKVILISGVTETKIRKQVAQAGADAFFFKPIELADFLDGVERTLGIVDTMLPSELSVEKEEFNEPEERAGGLSERIAGLRKNLDASSVFLVSELGKVMVRAGELPDQDIESTLLEDMLATFSATLRVSRLLNVEPPQSITHITGNDYGLFFSPVGQHYALLITTSKKTTDVTSAQLKLIQNTAQDIFNSLTSLGLSDTAAEKAGDASEEPEEESFAEDLVDPDLETLVKQAKGKKIKKEEVEAFWETMAEGDFPKTAASGDALTYEEALKLGLTPDEDGK
ncbi:MAG: response regulator [Chloroflexi bacterium]|nr:response regulator [Chloroflexota bacterium]